MIVDIDETVLDNSPFQAALLGSDTGYDESSWSKWCRARLAAAVPGAVGFLSHVKETGGVVFYISNRKAMPGGGTDLLEDTIANLRERGFPFADAEHVLLRTDPVDASKENRRLLVARSHAVVLLAGDSLADFDVAFAGSSCAERAALLEKFGNEIGSRFIVLPNPLYGAWEDCLYRSPPAAASSAAKIRRRIEALRRFALQSAR